VVIPQALAIPDYHDLLPPFAQTCSKDRKAVTLVGEIRSPYPLESDRRRAQSLARIREGRGRRLF
jgi:hypothetical protein